MCQKCFNASLVSAAAVVVESGSILERSARSVNLRSSPAKVVIRTREIDAVKRDQQIVNRCSSCRKKVGLTGFRCRCGVAIPLLTTRPVPVSLLHVSFVGPELEAAIFSPISPSLHFPQILDLSAYRHVASLGLLATPFVPFGGTHFAFRRSFTAVCRFCSGLGPGSFSSALSSRSSSYGRNSKKWIFLKDLLHISKSEGRGNEKPIQETVDAAVESTGCHNLRKSKTYATIPCSSPHCRRLDSTGCDTLRKTCLYQVSYGDASFTVGDFSTLKSCPANLSISLVMYGQESFLAVCRRSIPVIPRLFRDLLLFSVTLTGGHLDYGSHRCVSRSGFLGQTPLIGLQRVNSGWAWPISVLMWAFPIPLKPVGLTIFWPIRRVKANWNGVSSTMERLFQFQFYYHGNNMDSSKLRIYRNVVSLLLIEVFLLLKCKMIRLNISTVGFKAPSGTNL